MTTILSYDFKQSSGTALGNEKDKRANSWMDVDLNDLSANSYS